jgi:hypothetical protein
MHLSFAIKNVNNNMLKKKSYFLNKINYLKHIFMFELFVNDNLLYLPTFNHIFNQ